MRLALGNSDRLGRDDPCPEASGRKFEVGWGALDPFPGQGCLLRRGTGVERLANGEVQVQDDPVPAVEGGFVSGAAGASGPCRIAPAQSSGPTA
jgi:hypothetical protein